jgi:hypothetical protein
VDGLSGVAVYLLVLLFEPVKKHGPGVTADLRVVTPTCCSSGDPV